MFSPTVFYFYFTTATGTSQGRRTKARPRQWGWDRREAVFLRPRQDNEIPRQLAWSQGILIFCLKAASRQGICLDLHHWLYDHYTGQPVWRFCKSKVLLSTSTCWWQTANKYEGEDAKSSSLCCIHIKPSPSIQYQVCKTKTQQLNFKQQSCIFVKLSKYSATNIYTTDKDEIITSKREQSRHTYPRHVSMCEILPQDVTAVKADQRTDNRSSHKTFTIINCLPQQVMNVTASNPTLSHSTPYMQHNSFTAPVNVTFVVLISVL